MARDSDSPSSENLSSEESFGTADAMARNAAAREAERNPSAIPINADAALYQKAQEMNLGDVKTDEIRFSVLGDDYVVQGFSGGILYVKDGDWNSFRRIGWGTTRDAMEQGKTEGAGTSPRAAMSDSDSGLQMGESGVVAGGKPTGEQGNSPKPM